MDLDMTCPLQTDNADVLLDYCARSLDPERRAMLETHMRQCSQCREMATSQTAVWSALDGYEAEPVSAGFDRDLYARIDALDRVSPWERVWAPLRSYLQGQPAWKPVLSVGVATAAVAAVFFVSSDMWTPKVAHPDIDAVEVEQAERALEDMEMLRQLDASTPPTETEPQKEDRL